MVIVMLHGSIASMSILLACGASWGQTAETPLSFEVASVKAIAEPGAKSEFAAGYEAGMRAALADQGIRVRGQSVYVTDHSLRDLIRLAYEVKDHQINGPGWMAEQKYDLAATMPAATHRAQIPEMLRTLLAQRFQLQLHRELRPMTVYVLQAIRSGAKLTAAPARRAGMGNGRPGRVMAMSASMSRFAELLAKAEDCPVIDMTGIDGLYDFDLNYEPNGGTAETGPGLATALSEQLGLRLEKRRMPVELLVIDHVEKIPAEN